MGGWEILSALCLLVGLAAAVAIGAHQPGLGFFALAVAFLLGFICYSKATP